jgi:DNA-binding NarL/FixJ family response regulator
VFGTRPWERSGVGPTLLIVDDHATFRDSASALLAAEGFAVVGTAGDARAAIIEARRLRPEVVLLDIQLPDIDGFAVAEELCSWSEPPLVVLTSSREAGAYAGALADSSACAFIPKQSLSGAALAEAVR